MRVPDVAGTFVRWSFARAIFHRGWWLATSLYLVVVAELSAFELVLIGVAQAATGMLFEVPTGVLADTVSRKQSIVVGHVVMGTAMVATGLVTSFPALVATQMLWGLAWTFLSGADVAWLTDELGEAHRVPATLTRAARADQLGAAAGLAALGALATAAGLAAAMIVAGLAMWALGAWVAARFPERNFAPSRRRRWRASVSIFRRGVALARRDREILLVFAATVLVNGGAEAFGRLHDKRLVELGFPATAQPIVWLTALGLVCLVLGALALRIVEARIDGEGVAPRIYAAACALGAVGVAALALAPDVVTGMAGALLAGGITWSVTRTVGAIWVNRRTTSDVRATVQSFLAQAEYVGEIALGLALGVVAHGAGMPVALLGSCALVAAAGVVVMRAPRQSA